MSKLLVHGGRVVDPALGVDEVADVLLIDGRVAAIGRNLEPAGAEVIDASGLVVSPGFVDIHCHLRDPGQEYKETIATGTEAAARGGFTTVCCMPNTEPAIDTRATVEYVLRTAATTGRVRVLPIGCISRGREGHELAELVDLAEAGCIAFSDDGSPIADGALLRHAMEFASISGLTVIDHCEDAAISDGGVMHEGWVSTRLGLRGQSAAAEETAVARDIAVAAEASLPLHLAHISTRASVDLVRTAKQRGLPITAEVTPHHLTLTHEAVAFGANNARNGSTLLYDTNTKVNPPLRSADDVAACVEGLQEGVIDAIATDHAPHADYEKACEFDEAAFGISGLETALGLCMSLVHSGALELPVLLERLTAGPVRALGLERSVPGLGSLAKGAPGDIVLLDLEAEWVVEPERFASKGRNTPLAGRTLKGKVVATIYNGEVVWAEEKVTA
ncbi:MAG: dihydroorotase [Chloroflexi bacterium]|nr:dihydroorotase [Chloroflexota bacterium]MCI0890183.1 dihydroorotase [Chloroflexota bacterium]